jgi:hypothetical protein
MMRDVAVIAWLIAARDRDADAARSEPTRQ